MVKSKVAILKTSPATVLEDYHRLMNLVKSSLVNLSKKLSPFKDDHQETPYCL